ncbi:proton-dependent oligopeptide transporter, POT family, partial [Phenoliferia sp. Uapishka_3]
MGPAFALEDKSLASKKHAQVAILDGEQVYAEGEQALRQTEDHYDAEFPDDIYPTDEQKATLRRIPDKFPLKAYAVAFVELAERFSYYGTTIVFTNFIQQPLPPNSASGAGGKDGQSGALGLGQQASTGIITFLGFWVYLCPLVGGWLADAKWGRYKTIQRGIYCSLFAHVLIIIAGIPQVIARDGASVALLIVGIIILGLGTGCFKPNVSPLVAEQYRRKLLCVRTLKSGEMIIIDPALTASRIYMYFYLMINIGAIIGQVAMVYAEKYVGFWLAFTLPSIVFMICPVVMFLGRKHYVLTPPQGSTLGKALSTIKMCLRGRWSLNPARFYKNCRSADFWDTARPETYSNENRPATLTWDSAWVNEVARGLDACKVAIYFPIYWLPYNQISNNLTSQSAVLNTHGAPNDLINNIDPIAIIILIPLLDIFIYPILRRMGISLSPIRKIFWGFMTASASMLGAALIQVYVYKNSPCGYAASTCADAAGNALVPDINVWIQTPVYFLIALSEVLASITSLEYAYTKAPKSMRGMIQAIFLLTTAIANAITEAFVPLSIDPLIIWNYGSMAILALFGGLGFFFTFRDLDRREESLNDLKAGQINDVQTIVERHNEEKHPHST